MPDLLLRRHAIATALASPAYEDGVLDLSVQLLLIKSEYGMLKALGRP